MEGPTVEAGRTARRTAMASAPAPRARANTPARGATASRCWASTPGPAATRTRALGRRASATASAWRARGSGCTRASGRTDLRGATGCGSARATGPSTKGPGATGCRTATAPRPTRMEVGALVREGLREGRRLGGGGTFSCLFCLSLGKLSFSRQRSRGHLGISLGSVESHRSWLQVAPLLGGVQHPCASRTVLGAFQEQSQALELRS